MMLMCAFRFHPPLAGGGHLPTCTYKTISTFPFHFSEEAGVSPALVACGKAGFGWLPLQRISPQVLLRYTSSFLSCPL